MLGKTIFCFNVSEMLLFYAKYWLLLWKMSKTFHAFNNYFNQFFSIKSLNTIFVFKIEFKETLLLINRKIIKMTDRLLFKAFLSVITKLCDSLITEMILVMSNSKSKPRINFKTNYLFIKMSKKYIIFDWILKINKKKWKPIKGKNFLTNWLETTEKFWKSV